MKKLVFSLVLFTSLSLPQSNTFITDSLTDKNNSFLQFYTLPGNAINNYPVNRINNIMASYPGVVSYHNNFHIRGGRANETGFFLNGVKFNDLFTGRSAFLISPNAIEEIEYSPGFIPADLGNTSSGLFNYKLKTGGDKFQMNVEQLTDNITFTNDPYSGRKRLGAYYYGYNEFNINAGGPLYLPNLRFFVNANYLFQRDKNPQRYPGVNETFADPYNDTVSINLPAGIVPDNYTESFNLVSTFLFDLERIKINASAIYFNENEYVERNHILEVLNGRNSQIQRDGVILNIGIENKISNLFSFSINGNYYFKKENTSDQYLGDDYWSYGDSAANANAGIYWQRNDRDSYGGRYLPLSDLYVHGNHFISNNNPVKDHEKSEQENISIKEIINFAPEGHLIKAGGEFSKSIVRQWNIWGQRYLAGRLQSFKSIQHYKEYTEIQLKEMVLKYSNTNNFGYDFFGDKTDNGLFAPPKPTVTSFFVSDNFYPFNNFNLYLGLRYDHFTYNYKTLKNPEAPEEAFIFLNEDIIESGLKNTPDFHYLSPKIYLRHEILNELSYFIDYSRNVQSQVYEDLFEGLSSLHIYLGGAYDGRPVTVKIANLKPVVSSVFEAGFNYSFSDKTKIQLSFYNKKIKNQTGIDLQLTEYYFYDLIGSNSSSDNKGFEIIFDYKMDGFMLTSSLNYEDSRQTYYYNNQDDLTNNFVDVPLLNSNKINLKTLLEYNFSPLYSSDIFHNINISLLFLYNSGHPYIKTGGQYNEVSYAGTGVTPAVSQLDLKIEKGFSLFNNLNLGLYLYIINLFDAKNIYDVFASSGSADFDYQTGNREIYFDPIGIYAEQEYRLYTLTNINYNPDNGQQTMYGPPRQIGFGIKIKM